MSKIKVLKIIVRNFGLTKLKRPFSNTINLTACLEEERIIPDLIWKAPEKQVLVKYSEDIFPVNLGRTKFTAKQTENAPVLVNWEHDKNKFYSLYLGDLDAPSRKHPTEREWLHWLVGNIPGNDVNSGTVIAPYIGPCPQKNTGLHRFIFLVYEQKGIVQFQKRSLSKGSTEGRSRFNIREYTVTYCMKDPIAINFFFSDYDSYVEQLAKKFSR